MDTLMKMVSVKTAVVRFLIASIVFMTKPSAIINVNNAKLDISHQVTNVLKYKVQWHLIARPLSRILQLLMHFNVFNAQMDTIWTNWINLNAKHALKVVNAAVQIKLALLFVMTALVGIFTKNQRTNALDARWQTVTSAILLLRLQQELFHL